MPEFLIPAYNEERRIGRTLSALLSAFPDSKCLVVFDGNDHTPEVVRKFHNVRLITYGKRLGKGRAVIEGLKNTQSDDIIVLIDADLPVSISDIRKAITKIGDADMLMGSRLYYNLPRSRLYLHDMFNSLAKIFFPELKPFRDWQAGFKVINAKSINKVKDELIMNDFVFDTNLIYAFVKNGMKVIEYPMVWYHDESGSKVSKDLFKVTLMMFLSLVKLRVYYSPFRKILNTKLYIKAQSFLLKILR